MLEGRNEPLRFGGAAGRPAEPDGVAADNDEVGWGAGHCLGGEELVDGCIVADSKCKESRL